MTPEEFLRARLAEIEKAVNRQIRIDHPMLSHAIRDLIKNQRQLLEYHSSWPVMVETPPKIEHIGGETPAESFSYQITQHLEWMTQEQYVKKFGRRPPTAPLIRAMLQDYLDHPEFEQEWLQ